MKPTTFSRDVRWLKPLFDAAVDLVPAERIKAIKGFKTPVGQIEQTEGQCIKYSQSKLIITIRTHTNYSGTQQKKILEDVAFVFAHELAHTVYWEHSVEHLALTARILKRFVKPLKKLGIRDTSSRKHPKIR